ncbi:MAG: polysaccharide deacetylase family protein [candidate division WWE3 bacterium]|nr:polysaccharide deacetylase family protein [candidate division WWE3 bacterium]
MDKLYLTVDLEPDPWTNQIPREETETLLDLFGKRDQRVTWFVTGSLAAVAPKLVEQIQNRGHEICLHSFEHSRITCLDSLRSELYKSKEFITKYHPLGFRAPFVDLPSGSLRILKEYGFRFDSSIYGNEVLNEDEIVELPVTSIRLFGSHRGLPKFPQNFYQALTRGYLPAGGGLLTTLVPRLQLSILKKTKQPVMFIHPWQLSRHSFKLSWPHPSLLLYRFSCLDYVKNICLNYRLGKMSELL